MEEEIQAAGAQIIWVLEQTNTNQPGTAEQCRNVIDSLGSDRGWCVGDGQTQPTMSAFDDSPFSAGKGFDIIVSRQDMLVRYSTNHGIGGGNENIDGAALLAQVEAIVGSL